MSQEADLVIDYIEKLETGIRGFDFLAATPMYTTQTEVECLSNPFEE